MIGSRLKLIKNISMIEYRRNLRIQIRRMWSIFYTLFIQIVFLLIIYSSFRIGNFISTEDHLTLLLSVFISLQIFSLPAFNIIITYDSFVQDPILEILVIASNERSSLFLTKLLGINLFVYFIFIVNYLLGTIVLLLLFQDLSILKFVIPIILSFVFIVLFIGTLTTVLILFVKKNVKDNVSSFILPVTIFYIVPFLLVNSLLYQVFNPIIANLSPTVWMLNFVTPLIFDQSLNLEILFLPLISLGFFIVSNYIFENLEFD